jgi:hypothetical protein
VAVVVVGAHQPLVELPIQVVVAVEQVTATQAVLAVQALSFLATPAQFNISLVAMYTLLLTGLCIDSYQAEHWLLQRLQQ